MDLLNSMHIFVSVCEQQSFTAAAAKIGQSKAAVSKTISALEDHLKCRLLQRTTRSINLTDDGLMYLDHCRSLLEQNLVVESRIAEANLSPRGMLRISASQAHGQKYIAPLLSKFFDHYPDINVELSLNERFVNLVEEGYDLAIRIGGDRHSNLIGRQIGITKHGTYASKQYLDQHGTPQSIDDLRRHRCILYGEGNNVRNWTFKGQSIKPPAYFVSNNGDTIFQMMIDGLGVAQLPDFFLHNHPRADRLVCIDQVSDHDADKIMIVYPVKQHLPLRVRAFIDFLTRELAAA